MRFKKGIQMSMCIIIMSCSFVSKAQRDVSAQELRKRYSFARSYYGLDMVSIPNQPNTFYINDQNIISETGRSPSMTPAINIGASHFWGYADFYISITTRPIKLGEDVVENSINLGTLTGARLYPFRLKENRLSPYVGYKFSPIRYRQATIDNQNYTLTRTKSMLDMGLAYQTKKMYFYAGYNRIVNAQNEIYLSREAKVESSLPKYFLNFGVNICLETTQGAFTGSARELDSLFSQKNQAGFFGGIGVSAAFPTTSSSYIQEYYPFLDDLAMPSIFPDISIGYHFSKQDIILATAFRPINQKREAFGFEQNVRRLSWTAEVYKFLGDYHGFAPFLGAGIGHEWLHFSEEDNGTIITEQNQTQFNPSIVFGWDIRPSYKADYWLLRTNLRYSPFLEIENRQRKLSLQHIEFNFIQFVFYPQRYRMAKSRK